MRVPDLDDVELGRCEDRMGKSKMTATPSTLDEQSRMFRKVYQ